MTTIVLVRKNNQVVVAGDGQVSMGNTVVKSTASKVRKIEKRDVVAGFAGSTADALTLFERLEGKLEKHAGNLSRAAVELAKDWRTDKYLRRLEALMAVGDKSNSYIISGISCFVILNSTIFFDIFKIFASHSPFLLNNEKTSFSFILITLVK